MSTMRRAGPDDLEALVGLRQVMFAAMGVTGTGWEDAARAWFAEALGRPDDVALLVVDEGDGAVACALGQVDRRPPSPGNPTGCVGMVSNVATAPGSRRRGHARRLVTALLAWFDGETTAGVVRLDATAEGHGLYRSLGFADQTWPTMRRRRP